MTKQLLKLFFYIKGKLLGNQEPEPAEHVVTGTDHYWDPQEWL